jgi:hypothetical protein
MLERARPAGWRPSRAGSDDLRVAAGSEPSINLNAMRAQAQRRLQRQRQVEQLHRLGARATLEFLAEFAERDPRVDVRLAEYVSRLTGDMLAVSGGDQLAAIPIRRVR